MATINFTAWAPGVWAEDVWALNVWEGSLAGQGGGGGRGYQGDDEAQIERLVREKWDAIERRQALDRKEREAQLAREQVEREAAEAVQLELERIQAAPTGGGALPGLTVPGLAAPVRISLPRPVSPATKRLIREAMERDDEDALLLILAQL